VTHDRLELRRQRVELAEVVEGAIEASRPEIEAGGHALEVSLPEAPVLLDADPARLAQVLTNLLNNAAVYTPRGGLIRLAAAVAGDRLSLRVSDNGIGIDPAHLDGIFGLFSQVKMALDRPKGGLGIGLALVRGIVELHGGTVEARSAGPGQGSEFEIRLPLPRETRRTAVDSGSQSRRARRPRRVLVVDDNRDSAQSLALLLRLRGHEVCEAYDGLDAVGTAAEFRPDVVLLDIGLPGLNGYEVARRIRQEPWSREALLVAVTGWGQDADKRRSVDAGIDYHMTKPVDLTRLSAILDGSPPRAP
jgi:CheY-like chemotaxis protein